MNKTAGIILALVVVLGGGYFALSSGDKEAMMEKKADEMVVVENKEAMVKTEDTTATADTMLKVGSYEAYSPEKLAMAESGDVVLFFHASWCPSCRALNLDIEKNIESIPAGVSILKLDYDKETELKKKYGVTYQHTLVQVDKNGNMINKWSGSPKLSNLLSEIK